MTLRCLFRVVSSMKAMSCSRVSVVGRLFVVTLRVVLGRVLMMLGRLLVMLGCLLVMFGRFLRHCHLPPEPEAPRISPSNCRDHECFMTAHSRKRERI